MRVFRLLVRGTFLVENLITLYRFEQLPKVENGNQRVVCLLPWSFQNKDEQRWKTSMLTMHWPGAHWDTRTRVTEEAKPQVWGETPWNTDSPGLTDAPLSQTIPASSAIPIPLRLHRACRHTSSRASLSGKRSRMATRRGTAPRRNNSSCCLAEGDKRTTLLMAQSSGFLNQTAVYKKSEYCKRGINCKNLSGDNCNCLPLLTAVIRHSWDGPSSVKEQFLVWTCQHRQQSHNQACVTKTFTNHSWQEIEKKKWT